MEYSGAGGKLIHEKTWTRKFSGTVPLTYEEKSSGVKMLKHAKYSSFGIKISLLRNTDVWTSFAAL